IRQTLSPLLHPIRRRPRPQNENEPSCPGRNLLPSPARGRNPRQASFSQDQPNELVHPRHHHRPQLLLSRPRLSAAGAGLSGQARATVLPPRLAHRPLLLPRPVSSLERPGPLGAVALRRLARWHRSVQFPPRGRLPALVAPGHRSRGAERLLHLLGPSPSA